jgi:methyltransferase (TIGR00027 family)
MRALHSRHDPAPMLDDHWGDRLVPDTVRTALCQRVLGSMPPTARAKVAADPAELLAQSLRSNAAYADVITRARYAEDALKAAVERGVTQYVIIGAGFDSFAYRRPNWAAKLNVYEIDHPATQEMKRQRLAACGIDASVSVEFIAADLSAETLGSALARSSFQPGRLTFFSSLGVTMYLTREANLSALAAIASSAPEGSELVFNYVDQDSLKPGTLVAEAFSKLKSEVSSAGEAFLSGFDPAELREQLQAAGLLLLEDLNGDQAVARYDASGLNGLRSAAAAHIARARVAAPPLARRSA